MCMYNIVLVMQLFIHVVCVYVCIHMLGEYGITDTTLGNAGRNSKPIYNVFFDNKDTIENINKEDRYRNSDEVHGALRNYAQNNMDTMKTYYTGDLKYNLVKAGVLTDKGKIYNNNNMKVYHKIPWYKLQYYIDKLPNDIKGKDVRSKDVLDTINDVLKNDEYTNEKVIKHYITHAQNYFVQKGTIQSELRGKYNKFISKLKATKHIKPIAAVTGTVLGLGGIGGVAYEIGRANAMNITKDMNDHMHTHMTLFGILVIVCSVAATLALCVTVAYHITNKQQQPDIAYSVIGLM